MSLPEYPKSHPVLKELQVQNIFHQKDAMQSEFITFGAKFCSKHILEGNTFKELTDLTTKAAHS